MKLSILIAAYNVDKFIKECIQSCYLEELISEYEIIVVNDGSNDKTKEIIEDLIPKTSNLKLINKENGGLGAARNIGIENANGEYIWMIDGDDYLQEGIISSLIKKIDEKDSDAFAVNYNVVDENHKLINVKNPENYIRKSLTGSEYYADYYHNSYTWQYIFKKKLFIDHQIFFHKKINMQDSEILPKLMHHIKSIDYLDIIAYNYVQQQNSFTNTVNQEKRYSYFESIIVVKESLQNFAEKIKDEDHLLYSAIKKKIESLHQIVFNHLIFYKYKNSWFKKNIALLESNGMYPLRYQPKGKLFLVKIALNHFPVLTHIIINIIRK